MKHLQQGFKNFGCETFADAWQIYPGTFSSHTRCITPRVSSVWTLREFSSFLFLQTSSCTLCRDTSFSLAPYDCCSFLKLSFHFRSTCSLVYVSSIRRGRRKFKFTNPSVVVILIFLFFKVVIDIICIRESVLLNNDISQVAASQATEAHIGARSVNLTKIRVNTFPKAHFCFEAFSMYFFSCRSESS